MIEAQRQSTGPLTADDIHRICGDLPDWKVKEIAASGADLDGLEQAVAWSSGDDESTPMRHLLPASPASRVYDILMADEEVDEFDRGRSRV